MPMCTIPHKNFAYDFVPASTAVLSMLYSSYLMYVLIPFARIWILIMTGKKKNIYYCCFCHEIETSICKHPYLTSRNQTFTILQKLYSHFDIYLSHDCFFFTYLLGNIISIILYVSFSFRKFFILIYWIYWSFKSTDLSGSSFQHNDVLIT